MEKSLLPSKLILKLRKNCAKMMTDMHPSLLFCPALRCLTLPCAGLFYHLMQMPVLLASIFVVSGLVLLNSGVINLFRLCDPRLIALCFLQFREDGEVLRSSS